MAREMKVNLNVTLPFELVEKVHKLAKERNAPVSHILTDILRAYFNEEVEK
jgi:predicted DNA-binding protein